jgi:hypothetical protein
MSNRLLHFCVAVLPLICLASCTNNASQTTQAQSTEDKKMELCTNLARLNTAVATLKSMSPSSTVGDFRTARDQVRTAFADVKTSAQTVQDAKIADLEQAYQQLDQSMSSISDSATLNQGAQAIAPDVAAVEAAQTQAQSGLNCP